MRSFQISLIIIFLLMAMPVFCAEYYSWEDENGTTVISNVPPPGNVKKSERTISEESDQANIQTEETIADQKVGDAPPPLIFAEPPQVVVIPSGGSYIYMVPDMTGIYFYQGLWYRFHHGRWFRAAIYNGEWTLMRMSLVPHIIVEIPPEYPHYIPVGYYRINYHDLDREWRNWENSRHWHGFEWYQHELRPGTRKERLQRIEVGRAGEPYAGADKSAANFNPSQKVKGNKQKKSAVDERKAETPKVKHKKTQPGIKGQEEHLSPEQQEKSKGLKTYQGHVQ